MKYKKLINGPLIRKDWMKGMCKELGRLAHIYGKERTGDYTKGTNTVLFLKLKKKQGQWLIIDHRKTIQIVCKQQWVET